MPTIRVIKCAKCGKEVQLGTHDGRRKYCLDCSIAVRYEQRRGNRELHAEETRQKRKIRYAMSKRDLSNSKKINEIQQKADALNLSYGVYVSLYGG